MNIEIEGLFYERSLEMKKDSKTEIYHQIVNVIVNINNKFF